MEIRSDKVSNLRRLCGGLNLGLAILMISKISGNITKFYVSF